MKYIFIIIVITIQSFSQSLDNRFGTNGKVIANSIEWSYLKVSCLQPDNKIVYCGELTNPVSFYISRLNENGSTDNSFGQNGTIVFNGNPNYEYSVKKSIVQTDGKIVVACQIYNIGGVVNRLALIRFNTDGSLDTSFANQYTQPIHNFPQAYISDLICQNNKIIVVGTTIDFVNPSKMLVFRFNQNGELDNTFGPNNDGRAFLRFGFEPCGINEVKIQSDNKIILSGYKDQKDILVRLDFNGLLDTTFGTNGYVQTNTPVNVFYRRLNSISITPDDKIINAKTFIEIFTGVESLYFEKYEPNGLLDLTSGFSVTAPLLWYNDDIYINNMTIQNNDKIFLSGSSLFGGEVNNPKDFYITKLNLDGDIDLTFGNNGIIETDFENNSRDDSKNLIILNNDEFLVSGSSNYKNAFAKYSSDPLEISEFNLTNKINLFPNPAQDIIQFSFDKKLDLIKLEVFDQIGKKVIIDNSFSKEINVEQLQNGVYFVKLYTNDNQLYVAKFMKE